MSVEFRYRPLAHALRRELRPMMYRRSETFGADYSGMCAVASTALLLAMRARGDRGDLAVGPWGDVEHCWVEWQGFVFDITHSQFGAPDVLIAKLGSPCTTHYVARLRGADALRELRDEWAEQSPYTYGRALRGAVRRALARVSVGGRRTSPRLRDST